MKRNSTLFCLLFFIAANCYSTAKAQVNVTDSLALVDFYNSTNGPKWWYEYRWSLEKPVSTWYGVTVIDSRVTGLDISRYVYRFDGAIPASIGNLEMLDTLVLSDIGGLKGAIPAEIGKLVNLTYLDLSDNQLSGTIPAEIGNLVNLESLTFDNNQLSGAIPAEIGNLKYLEELYLSDNQLSGAIPAEIGNLVKLFYLYLNNNQLSGAMPAEIGNLVKLQYLELHNNQLSGAIPASFGKLKHSYHVDLSFNQLSQVGNVDFPKKQPKKSVYGYINNNFFTFDGLEFIAEKYPDATYTPQANIPIHQQGNTLSVYAGGILINNTYHWHQAGSTNSTTIEADSTFTPTQSGKYYVTVANLIAKELTLHSDAIDFTLSPLKQSSSTLIAKRIQPASIIQHMLVYPNPAKDAVHVQVKGTAMIVIADAHGRILLAKSINNSETVNVSALAPGIYYLQNKTSGEVQKIVVVH